MVLAVIGVGNMGQALVKGILRDGLLRPSALRLCDADEGKLRVFADEVGGAAFVDTKEAVAGADMVLLAVKPQVMDDVVSSLKEALSETCIVISIAAAVSLKRLAGLLPAGQPVARVFPNTPALVGAGVNAICSVGVAKEDEAFIVKLFSSCGIVIPCTEKQLDAIGSVSGTGPAWMMLVVEALADAAVKLGLPRDMALQVASATVYGSGKLALESGFHPAVLKDMVCSPGGTTIEGVIALEKCGLRAAMISAVEASDEKTRLLAGG